ncbi:MAG: hypothetical protein WDN01_14900 [Rhizomicrobium sp.]
MRSRFFLAFFLLLLATPACARSTLDSILPHIRAQHPGRLSDAEPWTDGEGNRHYRIKWMTPEGRVLYFDADANTGRYSNSGGDQGNGWRRSRGDGEDHGRRGRWNTEPGDSDGDGDSRGGGRGNWQGGGDWRGRDNSGGGDWHGHGRDGGSWHRGGNWGGGDWRGGGNGGDNGGRHHHGRPQ